MKKEQWIDVPKDQVWAFFSKPANLLKITPSEMKMQIVEAPQGEMHPGMILRYKVAPLFGIGLNWTSLITAVVEGEYFVDEMLEGPFKIWHHMHQFESKNGGTLIIDDLHYQIPLSPISKPFHPFLVQKELEKMFRHRETVVKDLF
ncbi:MAG: SRPBCC family protein [Bacteroidetes bacterium]|nr:SRPBCC family protein [Bacteroidota bacterium]